MATKKRKAVGIAHNPQLGTIVVLDDGSAVRLVVDHATSNARGWEPLPPFDQVPDDAEESAE